MEKKKNTADRFTSAYFDEKIDRRSSGSEKYEPLPPDRHGREVIPMWVADMDFRMAAVGAGCYGGCAEARHLWLYS